MRDAFDSELSVQSIRNHPYLWILSRVLIWTGTHGDTIEVRAGFITDFATIPAFMHGMFLPTGPYTRAAVLHDWLLNLLARGSRRFSSRDIDGMFRRTMEDLGTPWILRWLMWAGVRWGALFNKQRAFNRGFARDLPAVLALSLLGLIVLLPGAIGALISRGMLKLLGG